MDARDLKDTLAVQLAVSALAIGLAFILGGILPLLDFLRWGIPLAAMLVLARWGARRGALTLVLATAIVGLFAAWQVQGSLVVKFLIGYVLLGSILYYQLQKGKKGFQLIGHSFLLYLLCGPVALYLVSQLASKGPLEYLLQDLGLRAQLETLVMGFIEQAKDAKAFDVEKGTAQLAKLAPSITLLFIMFLTFLSVWLGEPTLKKFSRYKAKLELRRLQIPDKTIWFVIGALLLAVLNTGVSAVIGANLLLLLLALYYTVGISIFWHYLLRIKFSPMLRILLLLGAVLFMVPLSTIALLFLGLVDFYFDFRKLKEKQGVSHEGHST